MKRKRIVIALGHEALGSTLPEQQKAAARTAKAVADFIREDYQVVITQQWTAGWHDPYGNERILPSVSGIYSNSDICLLCDEPGIYRI